MFLAANNRMPRPVVAALVIAFALSQSASPAEFEWQTATPESQGMSSAKLEALEQSLADKSTKTFLVIRNGGIVWEWYAPDFNAAKKHYTASMAKALVGGIALALAIGDGKIALDDPAAKYIPEWRGDPQKSNITIRQLGSHTSGIEDAEAGDLPHDKLTGWKGDFWKRLPVPSDPFTISRGRAPVLFEPGSRFQYSNPGIAMLAYAMTAALADTPHNNLRTLLRDRVMQPIGVADEDWSVGYDTTFEVNGLPLVAAWGGGGFTARAAARVGRLMLRQGDWEGRQLLTPQSVSETTADAGLPGGNGMGWWTNARTQFPSMPRDAFYAAGAQHQTLLVIPSLNLICVRNGGPLAPSQPREAYQNARGPWLFDPLMEAIIK